MQQRVDKVEAPILCLVAGLPAWARPRWEQSIARPQVASTCAWRWRHARRGGNSRSPPYLYWRHARQGAAEPGEGRCVRNPLFLLDGNRQAGHGLPWRSLRARCWKCWTPSSKQSLVTTTLEIDFRPVRRDVCGDLNSMNNFTSALLRSHGGDSSVGAIPKTK